MGEQLVMKKYKYIFLDLDGPVLDGKQKHYNCYKNIVEEMGGIAIDIETYWEEKRNGNNKKIVMEYSGLSDCVKYEMFISEWKKRIETISYLKFDTLKPQVKEVLYKVRKICDRLILVTMRNNMQNLIWQLKSLEIYESFDDIIACNSGDKDIKYKAIMNKYLNEDIKESLVIGDTEVDLYTADRLGANFIGIINGIRNEKVFQKSKSYYEMKDFLNEEIVF